MSIEDNNIYGVEEIEKANDKVMKKDQLHLIKDMDRKREEKIWYWRQEFNMVENNEFLGKIMDRK